jgi:hypothetical protein
MDAISFWKKVTMEKGNLLRELIDLLRRHHIRFCVIGGQGVNAYVEPLVSLDLDLVIAMDQLETARQLLTDRFEVKEFSHSLNIYPAGSDLRIQVQTDPRYGSFVEASQEKDVLGVRMPVAALEDVLKGKIWAVQDLDRRASKRQKDLADIARILETFPKFRSLVPEEVLKSLL